MMKNFSLCFVALFAICGKLLADPIETPEFDERNKFVIHAPEDWAYRTFNGDNGLIGVLWPIGNNYNQADTVVFIFAQEFGSRLPAKPANIHLFTEKCPQANFVFSKNKDGSDPTKSIEETYFTGRCGRTMILFEEKVGKYAIIAALISSKHVPKEQLDDARTVVNAYKKEIEKYIKDNEVAAGDQANTANKASG
jgi:hypothetical protein